MSTETIIVGFITSTIGVGIFVYGKKQTRLPHLIAGILLMAAPLVVPSALSVGLVSGGILVALRIALAYEN